MEGPLRDIFMPVAGFSLLLYAVVGRHRPLRGSLLFALCSLAPSAALVTSYLNHHAQLEADALAAAGAAAESARLNRLAEEEAERLAKEIAAKRVDGNWLVGSWVPVEDDVASRSRDLSTYCATDNFIEFKRDGRYEWYLETGRYELVDNTLRLTNRRREADVLEEDGVAVDLESSTLQVERMGKRLRFDGGTFIRC